MSSDTPDTQREVKAKAKPVSRSLKANLYFPVGRIHRYLKQRTTSHIQISEKAAIYTAAVLEYLTAEVLHVTGSNQENFHVKRITPRRLQLAIRNDRELDELIKAIIPGGGVIPHINTFLLDKKKGKGNNVED